MLEVALMIVIAIIAAIIVVSIIALIGLITCSILLDKWYDDHDNEILELSKSYFDIVEKIAELNEVWRNYGEPKEHWCITMYGGITRIKDDEEPINDLIEIGNYFNSKEDAYDALDNLKAWKRLKDKGFKVDLWDYDGGNYQERIRTGKILFRVKDYEENDKDLDLLFGGEE